MNSCDIHPIFQRVKVPKTNSKTVTYDNWNVEHFPASVSVTNAIKCIIILVVGTQRLERDFESRTIEAIAYFTNMNITIISLL